MVDALPVRGAANGAGLDFVIQVAEIGDGACTARDLISPPRQILPVVADFIPVLGDIKAMVEAVQFAAPANLAGAAGDDASLRTHSRPLQLDPIAIGVPEVQREPVALGT